MSQQRLWQAFAVVAGVSLAIQLSLPRDADERAETSWDHAPRGHAGLFALLERFEATPGRWLSGLSMPSIDETLWFVAPQGACEREEMGSLAKRGGEPARSDGEAPSSAGDELAPGRSAAPFRYVVRPWIEAGGTAIVWLSHPPLPDEEDESAAPEAGVPEGAGEEAEAEARESPEIREDWRELLERTRADVREGRSEICDAIAGFRLPPRRLAGLEGGLPPREGPFSKVVFSVGRAVTQREDFAYQTARMLPGSTLAFFELEESRRLSGWRPLWVEADEFTPFALERRVGAGRLVVVADARVLTNGRLGEGDSAPFAFDWVRDYGEPWIDEHAHGVVPESGTLRYLAGSPAWAAGVGLLALGGLVLWRGQAWPARRVSEVDPDAPTLSTFVDSVALLYARSRDHQRVFERYRGLSLERIRRVLGLAPGTPAELVVMLLRAREGVWLELGETGYRDLLTGPVAISSAEDLERVSDRLDALVAIARAGRDAATGREAGVSRGAAASVALGGAEADPSRGSVGGGSRGGA